MSKATAAAKSAALAPNPEDLYPDWDKNRHQQMIGKIRFVGSGGNIFPAELMGAYWTDPRLQRQVCKGLNRAGEAVWVDAPDKPLPGFVSLDSRETENEDVDDDPIPYDYELPAYASASSIAISNFDQNNPVGEASRDPVAQGEVSGQMDEDFARFAKRMESDPEHPAE